MKFISKAEYEALQRKVKYVSDEEAKKVESEDRLTIKRLNKQLDNARREHAEEIEDITRVNERSDELHNEEIQILHDKIADLEADASKVKQAKKDNQKRADDLDADRVQLDYRNGVISAKEKAFGSLADEIATQQKEFKAKTEGLRDEGYQTGYADGIADGLRKVGEITAADRTLLEKVILAGLSKGDDSLQAELAKVVKGNLSEILTQKTTVIERKK